MSEMLWKAAPTMLEEYFSNTGFFKQIEDTSRSEVTTGATDTVWLKFTINWHWPGPIKKLYGGPVELQPRLGIRQIPYATVKVDYEKAFPLAWERMKKINGGNMFAGPVSMYWVLSPEVKEPVYHFQTELGVLITVGAYTGEVKS
jgi:hypothetical protein